MAPINLQIPHSCIFATNYTVYGICFQCSVTDVTQWPRVRFVRNRRKSHNTRCCVVRTTDPRASVVAYRRITCVYLLRVCPSVCLSVAHGLLGQRRSKAVDQ